MQLTLAQHLVALQFKTQEAARALAQQYPAGTHVGVQFKADQAQATPAVVKDHCIELTAGTHDAEAKAYVRVEYVPRHGGGITSRYVNVNRLAPTTAAQPATAEAC